MGSVTAISLCIVLHQRLQIYRIFVRVKTNIFKYFEEKNHILLLIINYFSSSPISQKLYQRKEF